MKSRLVKAERGCNNELCVCEELVNSKLSGVDISAKNKKEGVECILGGWQCRSYNYGFMHCFIYLFFIFLIFNVLLGCFTLW